MCVCLDFAFLHLGAVKLLPVLPTLGLAAHFRAKTGCLAITLLGLLWCCGVVAVVLLLVCIAQVGASTHWGTSGEDPIPPMGVAPVEHHEERRPKGIDCHPEGLVLVGGLTRKTLLITGGAMTPLSVGCLAASSLRMWLGS